MRLISRPVRWVFRALHTRAAHLAFPALRITRQCRALATPGVAGEEARLQAWRRQQKVVVLTGPTAVGKTNVSLALAELLDGEIISADSVQVYKGLDIGSDKVR